MAQHMFCLYEALSLVANTAKVGGSGNNTLKFIMTLSITNYWIKDRKWDGRICFCVILVIFPNLKFGGTC